MTARLDRRRHALLAAVAVALTACPRGATRPPALLPADPTARLAAVQAAEARVQTLRARFSSVTRLPDGERSADGVLLVAKPDRFRLRLMLPFGITVFDFLEVGDQSWMVLPLASQEERAKAGAFAPFSRDDLGQAFLRGEYAFPGICTASGGGDAPVAVSCRVGGELRRTLVIGRDGISEETSYAGGDPRLRIRYGDYRDIGSAQLPFHIVLDYLQRQQSVDIAIDRYEVNPALAADLFLPQPGAEPQRAAGAQSRRAALGPSADG